LIDRVVQLLADRGAALSAKNRRRQTPLAILIARADQARQSTVALHRKLGASE